MNKTVLAADTSSVNLTLALWKNGKLFGQKNLSGPKGRSHLLAHALDQLLKKSKLSVKKIDVAAFGLGPGSYTGLRIGLASLKALQVSQPQLRACGFSSLDLIAAGIKKPSFAVTVDARRQRVYANFYKRDKGLLKHLSDQPLLLSIEELTDRLADLSRTEKIALAGDALNRYGKTLGRIKNCEHLGPNFWYPRARNAWNLVLRQIHQKSWLSPSEIRPAYMRRSEAEEKWGIFLDERDKSNF